MISKKAQKYIDEYSKTMISEEILKKKSTQRLLNIFRNARAGETQRLIKNQKQLIATLQEENDCLKNRINNLEESISGVLEEKTASGSNMLSLSKIRKLKKALAI